MNDFGIRLKKLRKSAKMTQAQLAKHLGVKSSAISAYETGARHPSYSVLLKIAYLFHVSTDFLLGFHHDAQNDTQIDCSGVSEGLKKAVIALLDSARSHKK